MILTVDANEHLIEGKLARQLKNLGMVKAFWTKFNPEGGPTSYFRGRYHIDVVWHARLHVLIILVLEIIELM